MKKKILETLAVAVLITISLSVFGPAVAYATDDPAPAGQATSKQYIPLRGEGWNVFPNPGEGQDGVTSAKNLVAKIIGNVRFIIGAVAILLIIISATQLIMAQGEEEVYEKQQSVLILAVIGLAIVGLAGDIASILDVDKANFLKDPNQMIKQSRIFDRTVQTVLTFIKYIIGSVSVLFIVRSGMSLILAGDSEETLTEERKGLGWGLVGLFFILLATPLVNNVFFKIDKSVYTGIEGVQPQLDAQAGLAEIAGITNFTVSFVAPLAILSLVAGGVMYMVAGGDDTKLERSKKIMLWSLLGIIIIYGAFGIVSTIIAGRFEGI